MQPPKGTPKSIISLLCLEFIWEGSVSVSSDTQVTRKRDHAHDVHTATFMYTIRAHAVTTASVREQVWRLILFFAEPAHPYCIWHLLSLCNSDVIHFSPKFNEFSILIVSLNLWKCIGAACALFLSSINYKLVIIYYIFPWYIYNLVE